MFKIYFNSKAQSLKYWQRQEWKIIFKTLLIFLGELFKAVQVSISPCFFYICFSRITAFHGK